MRKKKTDSASRREQIYKEAELLIAQKGYAAMSMRDLAEAVGVEAASLYGHISSKDDMLWQIATRCANDFFLAVQPIAESELTISLKLKSMIKAHVSVLLKNQQAAVVFLQEWIHLNPIRYQEFKERRDAYENLFREVILQGVRENLFRNMDEKFSALTILSAINWIYPWYRKDGSMKEDQISDHLSEILLNGLIRSI